MATFDRRRDAAPERRANGEQQTLAGILDRLHAEGYAGQFGVREGARVLCFTCRRESGAGALVVETLRRLEGASDPDDLLVVVPVTCPRCGTRGTLVLHYGPESTPEEAEVLLALAEPRHPPDP
jgi:hypothetical protein